MAAAETPMKAMGETLQSLIEVNTAGFAGIQSSLRKEFSSQNKLLGGYLGKNLQRIADAITGSNDDVSNFSMIGSIKKGAYSKLSLKGNFSENEIIEMSIYQVDKNKRTLQVISDRAKPFIKK